MTDTPLDSIVKGWGPRSAVHQWRREGVRGTVLWLQRPSGVIWKLRIGEGSFQPVDTPPTREEISSTIAWLERYQRQVGDGYRGLGDAAQQMVYRWRKWLERRGG